MNQMESKRSFNYDHNIEKEYISNISDAFARAEEETKRAELMLKKWRKDSAQYQGNNKKIVIMNQVSTNDSRSSLEEQEAQVMSRINSLRRDLGLTQQPQQDTSFKRNPQPLQAKAPLRNKRIREEFNIQENQENSYRQEPNTQYKKSLDPQILEEISITEQSRGTIKRTEESYREKRPIIQLNIIQNDDDFTTQTTKQNNTLQDITMNSNLQHNQSFQSNTINYRDEGSFKLNKTDLNAKERYGLKYNEADLISNATIEKETEIILLDKHYKAILKSEKEELQRQTQKQIQQAQKDAERKYKIQIAEMREKVDAMESLELEKSKLKLQSEKLSKENDLLKKKLKTLEKHNSSKDTQIKSLQKKLDDLWERHQLEKENAKLVVKYELDQQNNKVINELTLRVREVEEELRIKEREIYQLQDENQELLKFKQKVKQMNHSKDLSKQQEKIYECEIDMLKQQNQQLLDQYHTNSKIESEERDRLKERIEDLESKYEQVLKDKEELEKAQFMETAKFRDSQLQQQTTKRDCHNCEKWRQRTQDLSEKYFYLLSNMRLEIEQIRLESKHQIVDCQKQIHNTVVKNLKDHLDMLRNRSLNNSSNQIKQRKNSVIVYSKNAEEIEQMSQIQVKKDQMRTLDETFQAKRRPSKNKLEFQNPLQMNKTIQQSSKKRSKTPKSLSLSVQAGKPKKKSQKKHKNIMSSGNLVALRHKNLKT